MKIMPIITIDGPSGSGKGALCKAISKTLQWNLLDSGIIYRILALIVLRHRINITSEKDILLLISDLDLYSNASYLRFKRILSCKNIGKKIQSQEVANVASRIAIFPFIRKKLLRFQRSFNKVPGLIAGGRDMGTVVFPNAPVKIFLNASLEKRAYRRTLQLQKEGFNVTFEKLLLEIQERDDRDHNRTIAPLIPAKDAIILDSTDLTIEQLTEKALQYAYNKLSF